MGGIEAYEEMTPDQVEAMSGGELLRQEAGNFSQVGEVSKVCACFCVLAPGLLYKSHLIIHSLFLYYAGYM